MMTRFQMKCKNEFDSEKFHSEKFLFFLTKQTAEVWMQWEIQPIPTESTKRSLFDVVNIKNYRKTQVGYGISQWAVLFCGMFFFWLVNRSKIVNAF